MSASAIFILDLKGKVSLRRLVVGGGGKLTWAPATRARSLNRKYRNVTTFKGWFSFCETTAHWYSTVLQCCRQSRADLLQVEHCEPHVTEQSGREAQLAKLVPPRLGVHRGLVLVQRCSLLRSLMCPVSKFQSLLLEHPQVIPLYVFLFYFILFYLFI